jgi:hypothetical protein
MVPLPPSYATTRAALHRVAVHVVARSRHAATGRFGLRATPGGFGTPAFGDEVEVVRVAGAHLVRERAKTVTTIAIDGASLTDLAVVAGVDLSAEFSAGHDTPEIGDPDAPLAVDAAATNALSDWFDLGWRALDAVLAGLGGDAAPAPLQLWPEHFDAGTDVGVGGDARANLGASPGDDWSPEPYLYVGPWDDRRPGDEGYWNAPFGAVLRYTDVAAGDDPVAFLREGCRRLSGA